jgi:HTH-type transcriptional regulator / antitoxin HigA
MAKRSPQSVKRGSYDNYLRMVRAFPLRPIRSESELDRAIEVIDSLIVKEDLDSGQEDYLDVLGDLVHKYEAEHDPMAAVSDADMVRFLLESNEMAQTELAQRSGIAESTISEILAGKRKLSRRHIASLSRVFRVSPAVFFPEAVETTPERVARILGRSSGLELSYDLLVSLASAFACDSGRACWRAFQELVAGDSPGTTTDLMASRLNSWAQQLGGSSCWWPVTFDLTEGNVQALADAFCSEQECWKVFREMVDETIPEMRAIQRDIAEEN